ncbi:MAG: hypothetical protein CR997_03095 [Acidobacteria bacterium]|nr:MAG: hypothetical protein CR997_03095 [Acidobacteriota bacterium]
MSSGGKNMTSNKGTLSILIVLEALLLSAMLLPLQAADPSIRMINHISKTSGGFDPGLILSNNSQASLYYTMTAYSAEGDILVSLTKSMEPNRKTYKTPQELFGSDRVSHIVISGDPGIDLTTTYTSVKEGSSPAHVGESKVQAKKWRVYPGDWSQVWDGLAIVNTGKEACNITISQRYWSDFVYDSKVIENVSVFEKKLVVLGDLFPEKSIAHFTIESDQPLAVMALRGTYADAPTSYLWQNDATPVYEYGQPPSGSGYHFAEHAPWYECPEELPENAVIVPAFEQVYHYFGAENHREIEQTVVFPNETNWEQVGLQFTLECPENGLCDHWDRSGSIQLVLNPDEERENWEYLELTRFITPYRMGMCQFIDVTPLAAYLQGEQKLVSWIDTWVGPGHSDGEGWRVSANLVFLPGQKQGPREVINVWGRRNLNLGNLEEGHDIASQITPVNIDIPDWVTKVEAHLIATGHSFGNTYNCAEFCEMRNDIIVNNIPFSSIPWRGDCEFNPVSPQAGTWRYDRNGWCPGAIVLGHQIDITQALQTGAGNTFNYNVLMANGEPYENTQTNNATPYQILSLKLYLYE